MCGRINVSDNEGIRLLLEAMGMHTWPSREPRFNIVPSQTLDVVQLQEELKLAPMHWGVTMNPPGKHGMVKKSVKNARDDKLWSSRLWKPMIESGRVLIPVNGFYEWKRQNRKMVAAYHIAPAGSNAMFLAGLYKQSTAEPGLNELVVVTTMANRTMSQVHDRMPVIFVSANEAMAWLQESDNTSLLPLIQPVADDVLRITEVDGYVNKSTNQGPRCVAPKVA